MINKIRIWSSLFATPLSEAIKEAFRVALFSIPGQLIIWIENKDMVLKMVVVNIILIFLRALDKYLFIKSKAKGQAKGLSPIWMERKRQFEVRCVSHGLLGIVSVAYLGISLFEAHRLKSENCLEAEIKPILRETMSDKQLEEFNSEVILTLTLNQMEMVKRQNERIRRNNGKI